MFIRDEQREEDALWMEKAIALAKVAMQHGEVPVGAVLVRDGELLGEGWNRPISLCDPSAHAEVLALRDAGQNANNYRLPGSCLYVTIEPCTMCLGAMIHARVERIVFGAHEPRAGVLESQTCLSEAAFFNHHLRWCGGVRKEQCSQLIKDFFAERRN